MDREKFLEITKTAVKHGVIFYAKTTFPGGHWLGIFNRSEKDLSGIDAEWVYSFVNFFYPDNSNRVECYTYPDNIKEPCLDSTSVLVDFRPATKAECDKFHTSLQLAGLKWYSGIDRFSFTKGRPTSLIQAYELPGEPFAEADDGIMNMTESERGSIYGEVRDLLDQELHSFKMKVLDLVAEKLKLG